MGECRHVYWQSCSSPKHVTYNIFMQMLKYLVKDPSYDTNLLALIKLLYLLSHKFVVRSLKQLEALEKDKYLCHNVKIYFLKSVVRVIGTALTNTRTQECFVV